MRADIAEQRLLELPIGGKVEQGIHAAGPHELAAGPDIDEIASPIDAVLDEPAVAGREVAEHQDEAEHSAKQPRGPERRALHIGAQVQLRFQRRFPYPNFPSIAGPRLTKR